MTLYGRMFKRHYNEMVVPAMGSFFLSGGGLDEGFGYFRKKIPDPSTGLLGQEHEKILRGIHAFTFS